MAVTGPRIDMPRLPHRPIWSNQPSTRGGGSSSVYGASLRGAGRSMRSTVAVMATPHAGITRLVRRSATLLVALSARCVRAPACLLLWCLFGPNLTPSLEQTRQSPVGERLAAGLARRAVVQRRVGEGDFPDHVAADRAGLAGAPVPPHAELLLGLEVSRRPPARPPNGVAEHLAHRSVQPLRLLRVELRGGLERRQLGRVQDLVGVGVADAGQLRLVAQQALDLRAVAREQRPEVLERVAVGERVGPEPGYARDLLRVADDVHRKSLLRALLGEVEASSVRQMDPE